jgi:hypothetical protein
MTVEKVFLNVMLFLQIKFWKLRVKAPYTFLVKLGDFSSELSFPVVFHTETAQFTQEIPQFPHFICRHHDGIISGHSTSTSVSSNSLNR